MPCFPTIVFPFLSSKSDVLCLMAPIITFSYLTLFVVRNCVSVFEKPLCLNFTSKVVKFYPDNLKCF